MVAFLIAAALAASPSAEQAALLKTFREEFVAITPGKNGMPGEFSMGRESGAAAERPAHTVKLGHEFAIAKYEAPQNLWESVMGENPSKWQGPRNSVEMLSYDEAAKFCVRATELMQAARLIGPDEVIRLPTEAEWEYCARAGTATLYSFGDDPAALGEYAWFTGNAAGNDPPVGAKKANPWKLYDMHGYLWEWCADDWHDSYKNAPADGQPWLDEVKEPREHGVLRGGSWKDKADRCTSTFRLKASRALPDDAVGLRCVLE